MKTCTRRDFVRGMATLGGMAAIAACAPTVSPTDTPVPSNPTPLAKAEAASPVLATAAPAEVPASPMPSEAPVQAKATASVAATQASAETPTLAAKTPSPAPAEAAYLAVARGASPEAITMRAVAAIGGIERFAKKGYNVIIKPNICNANHGPEYASTTNPEVVATLVKLCLGAGAKSVRVLDYPFSGSAQQAYVTSGIAEAVKAAGGEMELMAQMKFANTDIPNGKDIKKWSIYQPILQADLVINVPIAKDHGLSRLTLAGKNLMGVIEDRGSLHRNLHQRLADLATLVKPQLTVIDAVRILMANGPTGGNLKDVKQTNTVIASQDMVAADAYATTLFGMTPEDIGYIRLSAQMGLGNMDLKSINIAELNV